MSEIEALIERCVLAGIEARRAHDRAQALRAEAAARHAMLTAVEQARVAELDAVAERHSRRYVAAQAPLYADAPTRFQARIGEVAQRIAERLR